MFNYPVSYVVFGLVLYALIARVLKNWSDKRALITACVGIAVSSALPLSMLFSHQLDLFTNTPIGVISRNIFFISMTMAFLAMMRLVGKCDSVKGFHAYAGFWIFLLWLILAALRFHYEQNVAFISMSNKVWHSWFGDPKTGLGRNILFAYGYLNILIANRFVEIAAILSMAASYLLYPLLMAFYGYPRNFHWMQLRSPRWLGPFFVGLIGMNYLMTVGNGLERMAYLLSILISIMYGVYAFFGAVYLAQLFAGSKTARYLGIVVLTASWISGLFFFLLVGIGILDNLFGLKRSPVVVWRGGFGSWRISRRGFNYLTMVLGVCAFMIVAALSMGLWERFIDPEQWNEYKDSSLQGEAIINVVNESTKPMVRIHGKTNTFKIDMYEYSAQPGQQPMRNVDYLHAEQLCKSAGKRLCTESEWEFACRCPENLTYQFDNEWSSAVTQIRKKCNVHLDVGEKKRPWANTPSQCAGKWPIYNLTGNMWEWIAYEKSVYLRALKGGSYLHGGEKNTKCAHELLILKTQLPYIDLSSVGFRCCENSE